MTKKILRLLPLIAFITMSFSAHADNDVIFTASAQNTVVVGQPFQLVYKVNASGKDLRLPEIKDFEIIAGPYTSTSSSTQWVNGKMTSSREVRYTYTLLPQKEGSFTIPAASIMVNKEKYHANVLNIKVLPEDKTSQQANPQSNNNRSGGVQTTQNISSENLFVRPIISRTKVREQEAILLTYRLYSRVDISNVQSPKFPDFQGFLVQEIELPKDRRMESENYNGMNYYTFDLQKVLLFPQRSGEITIDPMSIEILVRLRTQHTSRSFFDDFFDTYQEVSKTLTTNRLKVDVQPLPTPKPTDFSGVVGHLSVSSKISETEIKANEPITIVIKISGNGNMKMLKTPDLKFPKDFETYEPKVTNSFTSDENGQSGSKTIEFLAIPRHDGNFTIPPATLSYFDPTADEYKTVSTNTFNISVKKGDKSDANTPIISDFQDQEKVSILATDIRYIDTAPLHIQQSNEQFAGTTMFWLSYLLPLLIAAALLYFFRKQARENADVALMRNKKANKVAGKRLKAAEKYCKTGNKTNFYDEILRAIWGYLSDKLSIPVADLNKDNISSNLKDHGVADEIIENFIALLNNCEFERYAPASDQQSAMEKIYESTLSLISTLENTVKRTKKPSVKR